VVKRRWRAGRVAQAVECLLSKCKALNSNPTPSHCWGRKEERETETEREMESSVKVESCNRQEQEQGQSIYHRKEDFSCTLGHTFFFFFQWDCFLFVCFWGTGFELRAYNLSHSTSPFLWRFFFFLR
jgi:hypothetical protein